MWNLIGHTAESLARPCWNFGIPALLLTTALTVCSPHAIAGTSPLQYPSATWLDLAQSPPDVSIPAPAMNSQSVQLDPLDSPHPIPWNWVLANLMPPDSKPQPGMRYYRSHSLLSPNGKYAAYSRIQMQVKSDFTQSRVSSVLFLENLETGDLQAITAASPLADNPFTPSGETDELDLRGTIAILIPIAWSETGDRLLAREFESIFSSDIASDYAVIWDQSLNRTQTVAPTRIQYTNAILLGWSQTHPDRALFRAGNLGEDPWPLWTVDPASQTTAAPQEDKPLVFGRVLNSLWTGPQSHL